MFKRFSKREPEAVVSAPERDILKVRYQLIITADRFASEINITINPIRNLFSFRVDCSTRNENLSKSLREVITQARLEPSTVEFTEETGRGLSVKINIAITAEEIKQLLTEEKDEDGEPKLDPLMYPQLMAGGSRIMVFGNETRENLSRVLGDALIEGSYRFYLTNKPCITSCIIERTTGLVFDAEYLTLKSSKLGLEDVKVVAVVNEIGTTSEAKLALCNALEKWLMNYFTCVAPQRGVEVEEVELISNSNYYHAGSAVEYLHQHWRFRDYVAVMPITSFYPRPIIMHYKRLQQKPVYRVLDHVCVEIDGERTYKDYGVESFTSSDLWICPKNISILCTDETPLPPLKRVYWKPGRMLATRVYEVGSVELITPDRWTSKGVDEPIKVKSNYFCWATEEWPDGNALIGVNKAANNGRPEAIIGLNSFSVTLKGKLNRDRKNAAKHEMLEAYNEAEAILAKRIELADLEQKALETEEQLREVTQRLESSGKAPES